MQYKPENQFGKFPTFEQFITAYQKARRAEEAEEAEALSMEERRAQARQPRNVVEVRATLASREPNDDDPDGGRHVRLNVTIAKVVENDPDVENDVNRCLASEEAVFVAIRIGDRMGIMEEIHGLDPGAELHLRGEWITKEAAHSHDGRQMSVLHFTHHPLGFTCVEAENKCYR